MNFKSVVFKIKPLSWFHSVLKSHGFTYFGSARTVTNRIEAANSSAESINWLKQFFSFHSQEPLFAAAGVPQQGEINTPKAFHETLTGKLHDIKDYFSMINSDKGSKREKKSVQNGQMTLDEEEIKQLGKQMDKMRTNKELKEDGYDSDPIQ